MKTKIILAALVAGLLMMNVKAMAQMPAVPGPTYSPARASSASEPKDAEWTACTRPHGGGLPLPQVITICNRVIASNKFSGKNLALAYYYRGNAYLNSNDPSTALTNYRSALDNDPNLARAHNNSGMAYKKLGNQNAAAQSFTNAVNIDPTLGLAYRNRAEIYDLRGDKNMAIADYDRALSLLGPNFIDYNNRGLAKYSLRQYDAAISDYNQALAMDPKNPNAKVVLDNIKLAQGSKERLEDAQRAEEQRRQQAETAAVVNAFTGLANAYVQTQQQQQAYKQQQAQQQAAYEQQQQAAIYQRNQQIASAQQQATSQTQGRTTDLDPKTGKPCVTRSPGRSEPYGRSGTIYRMHFKNTCGFTYNTYARIIPLNGAPTHYDGVQGSGIGPFSESDLTCIDYGDGSKGCSGFSESWVSRDGQRQY